MRAQNLPQSRVQQVGSRVVAPDGVAAVLIDNRSYMVADGQRLLEQGLVGADALHRQHAALDFGDARVAVRRGEPAGVARLTAGVAVEAGLVENHVHQVARGGGGNAYAVFHDSQDFGAWNGELLVAEESSLGQFAIGRAGGFLAAAFPAGAGAGLLFGAGGFEAFHVEGDAGITGGIDNVVERKAVRLVKMKRGTSFEKAWDLFNSIDQV